MREGIHPEYRKTVFVDANTGKEFLTRSTKLVNEKRTINGEEYQVITLEITSDTHPFWTGKMHHLDTAGRIDRFNKRFGGQIVGAKRKTARKAVAATEENEET
ncbi:MAG: type B 50S ribosomal protein L31 [Fibromonadaceae bacterium]|jgi:large subunit ribosomal protein L31|nr:type B 50S ribosomal protein L31 [Fibromonadaceae bacterium]